MLAYILVFSTILVSAFYLIFLRRLQRRRRVIKRPFPQAWKAHLATTMVLYRKLPAKRQDKLHQDIQLILDEVEFFGNAGLEITEPVKLLIAAHAALLINGLSFDYYQKLRAILVYPGAWRAPHQAMEGHVLTHSQQIRLGESWQQGRIILAWDTLRNEAQNEHSTSNVGIHEFAHQLDQLGGAADGAPPLASGEIAQRWQEVFSDAWQRRRQHLGGSSVIDEYGAESPAEFFAVASEAFFLSPSSLQQQEPALYQCLQGFYKTDPTTWAD